MSRTGNSDEAAKARGGSKLRASRVRRQRDRERSLDEDELEQRFGRANLSLSAPVFVPAAERTALSTPVTPKRSMAFVTERRGPSSSTASTVSSRRPKRSATAAASARLHKNIEVAAKKNQQQSLQQMKGRVSTCFSIWHADWNNGNDIPRDLLQEHRTRERPPASRPGKKRRRRQQVGESGASAGAGAGESSEEDDEAVEEEALWAANRHSKMSRTGNSDEAAKARGGSKLRASRVRRQRDRERSLDEDELEQRFGRANLSLSAPVFVPAAERTALSTPVTPKRSMAFVTERRGPSSSTASTVSSRRPKRSATAAASARLHKNIEVAAKKNQQQSLQQMKGRVSTCFSIWHADWNNGNDIPRDLLQEHRTRERPPASRPGKKRRRRQQVGESGASAGAGAGESSEEDDEAVEEEA
ncbi:hypothetical protein PInf_027537 [Phytophthora infestans]|nr:hypothetical protein PInf_027537 [Phytophthora infestans]